MNREPNEVSNKASALGEAVGVLLEASVNRLLQVVASENNCVYIATGPKNTKTGRATTLILTDANGVDYRVDGIIANLRLQPLILIESKYIRYTRHNRDKGSWVAFAHPLLRKRFSSVRASIAVLAGRWSPSSKALMTGADITLFEIPFKYMVDVIAEHGIKFDWHDKDKETPSQEWDKYVTLSQDERTEIGDALIDPIRDELRARVSRILDNSIPRTIRKAEVQITTNLGEAKVFSFDNVESVIKFLQDLDQDEILSTEGAPTILENRPLRRR